MGTSLAAATVALALTAVACGDGGPVARPSRSPSRSPSPAVTSPSPAPSPTPSPKPSPSRTSRTPSPRPTSVLPASCPSPGARPATPVSRGPTGRKVVALTFDAGSDRGHAAAILDTLARERVPASFGITGAYARANPDVVARIARDGHQVVNHSDTHPHLRGLTTAQRCRELRQAEQAVEAAAPGTVVRPWFRPPYGERDASVDRDVAAAGYRYEAMWTVDSRGWRGVPAADVVDRCLDEAVPGAIYLFHVGAASTDAAALPAVVAGLRARGYGFATLSGLVGTP